MNIREIFAIADKIPEIIEIAENFPKHNMKWFKIIG